MENCCSLGAADSSAAVPGSEWMPERKTWLSFNFGSRYTRGESHPAVSATDHSLEFVSLSNSDV
jgi:hypothetical protein